MLGEFPAVVGHGHGGDIRIGVLHAHEDQPRLGHLLGDHRHGADQGQGVEPVVDPATPQDHLVVLADAVDDPPQAVLLLDGRLLRQPEGRHVDESAERGVLVVARGVDPTLTGELAEPEVALLLRGADEVVAASDLVVEGFDRHVGDLPPLGHRPVALLLEGLQMEGVIDVGDDHRVAVGCPVVDRQEDALEDDDVGSLDELARVLVIDCSEDVQVSRVMARSGLSAEEVRTIMATQASRATRLAAADDVVLNDDGLDSLHEQLDILHARYLKLAVPDT